MSRTNIDIDDERWLPRAAPAKRQKGGPLRRPCGWSLPAQGIVAWMGIASMEITADERLYYPSDRA